MQVTPTQGSLNLTVFNRENSRLRALSFSVE